MDLREAMTSGMFVEFRDALGNSAGSAVYFDWAGGAVPRVGDHFTCRLAPCRGGAARTLAGWVKFRSFDIQTGEDGQPCVWVRLTVEIGGSVRSGRPPVAGRLSFSRN
jgi:hypothetical protein